MKINTYNVVVVGAGISGVSAAISAARAGCSVILIEKNHFLGGIGTSSLMCSMTNSLFVGNGKQVVKGFTDELIQRLIKENGCMPHYRDPNVPQIPYNPEIMKRVMIKMLNENGVKTLYGLSFLRTNIRQNRIDSCVFYGRGGEYEFFGNQFVDATGDILLFESSGAEYDETDDHSSLLYLMGNVNIDEIINWLEENPYEYSKLIDIPTSLESTVKNWREYGIFHLPHGSGKKMSVFINSIQNGTFSKTFGNHFSNLDHFGLFSAKCIPGNQVVINSNFSIGNSFNIFDESKREEEGRLLIEQQIEFIRNNIPGFQSAYLTQSAWELGHRTARKIKGKKSVSFMDLCSGKVFPDRIGFSARVDVRKKPERIQENKAGNIPLGCLVADYPVNAIVASGKNISAEKFGANRCQPACSMIGSGAGTAAALAVINSTDVSIIDYQIVQKELIKQNTII